MLEFISPSTVPPGGTYNFEVSALRDYGIDIPADVTAKFSFPTEPGLLQQIKQYLRANQIEVPKNLIPIVRDYICRTVPEGFCQGDSSMPRTKFLSKRTIEDGTRILFESHRMSPTEFYVPQAEAERRARICANCPMNLPGICPTCTSMLGNLMAKWLGGRSTPFDNFLSACGKCGCALKAKVHVSIKALALTQKHDYPSNCWMHGTECDSEKPAEQVDTKPAEPGIIAVDPQSAR